MTMSRWLIAGETSNQVLNTSLDDHIVSLNLRATRLELRSGAGAVFDGAMRAGVVHVTGPNREVTARISAPCDILHLHVPTRLLRERLSAMGAHGDVLGGLDGRTLSDPLVEQLAKLLLTDGARADAVYKTAIVQTLLTRILHMAQSRTPAGSLAKWRLRRVQALIDANLAESLTLSDLAAAAGLSRMHFAAQFRAATGSSPHEYLLCQRIEAAKTLLAETETPLAQIALNVGFLAQAHFTTVFKRLTAATPAQWRRTYREAAQHRSEPASARPSLGSGSGATQGMQP